jgi:hypothetical protein
MLHVLPNSFGWYFDNWNAALTYPNTTVARIGEAITFKASANLAGATAVVVASSAEMAFDSCGVGIQIVMDPGSGVDASGIWTLAVDPAGGTSYTDLISNVPCGPASDIAGSQFRAPVYLLPLKIRAGSTVAVRAATVKGSDANGLVQFMTWGAPSRPEMVASGGICETLGYTTGVLGTAISCAANPNGRTAGAWTQLGTTTFAWIGMTIGAAVASSTVTAEHYWIEIGHGDGTTCTPVAKITLLVGNNESSHRFPDFIPLQSVIPAGATVYARIRGSATSPVNQGAVSVVAVGVG